MRKLSIRVTDANPKILFFESNRYSKRQTKSAYGFDYSLGNFWNQDREAIIINGNPGMKLSQDRLVVSTGFVIFIANYSYTKTRFQNELLYDN